MVEVLVVDQHNLQELTLLTKVGYQPRILLLLALVLANTASQVGTN